MKRESHELRYSYGKYDQSTKITTGPRTERQNLQDNDRIPKSLMAARKDLVLTNRAKQQKLGLHVSRFDFPIDTLRRSELPARIRKDD
jgi:hypothetical protein